MARVEAGFVAGFVQASLVVGVAGAVVGQQRAQFLEQFPERARRLVAQLFLVRIAGQLAQALAVGIRMLVQQVGLNVSTADFYTGSLAQKLEDAFGRAGVPLGDVARRMGHSVETLVSTYVGALDGDEEIANARIDAVLAA